MCVQEGTLRVCRVLGVHEARRDPRREIGRLLNIGCVQKILRGLHSRAGHCVGLTLHDNRFSTTVNLVRCYPLHVNLWGSYVAPPKYPLEFRSLMLGNDGFDDRPMNIGDDSQWSHRIHSKWGQESSSRFFPFP